MKVWMNGVVMDAADAKVSVLDHGFTVGDGCFETCKVVDGVPFALTRHLQRLDRSSTGLGLPVPDHGLLRGAIDELIAAMPDAGRLRITYTGGPGPLGSDRGGAEPTLVVAVSPEGHWDLTTSVSTVPWPRSERSAVAGLKTTSYAENVVALAYAHERGSSEAIFGNLSGSLCEGTGSNVFLVLDGELITPPLSAGCLAGVTRDLIVEWCGASEREVPLSALAEAEEAFLTSSTRDAQAIGRVDGKDLPSAPGPISQEVAAEFARRSKENPDP
jgi:branched-chain amino acid aminotransferase